jgi:anaerobic selenocysteine-containing dehydrogenase
MHHSPRLVKGGNPCRLTIHPEDAAARDIEADSLVRVSSRRSSIELPVTISPDIMPGVVCMPHLWGHNRAGTRQRVANGTPGVSMNDLTDVSVIDELTGNAVVNGVPVRVDAVSKAHAFETAHADETVEEFVAR